MRDIDLPDPSIAECPICLGNFEDTYENNLIGTGIELATPLPCDLRHYYHLECIRGSIN